MTVTRCAVALTQLLLAGALMHPPRLSRHAQLGRPSLHRLYAVDVSGLPVDLSADSIIQGANLLDSNLVVQNLLILAFGVGYLAYERRPRGSVSVALLEVRKSSVPKGSLGVFATGFIPKGCAIGTYPGFLVKVEDALKSKASDAARDSAKKYMWALDDDLVLDPTNAQGLIDLGIPYALGLYRADTTMGRVNEPPVGKDCNVFTKITAENVEYIAERDIFSGEELFIDYGCFYDRSQYEDDEAVLVRRRAAEAARRRMEEEEMLTLQPVTREKDKGGGRLKVDQDTTNPDGFIAKLNKKSDEKLDRSGILSPEAAVDMFAAMGSGMFAQSEEDKEFIASLTGVGSPSPQPRPKPKGILAPEDAMSVFGRAEEQEESAEEEEGLMESLKRQLGEQSELLNKRASSSAGGLSSEEAKPALSMEEAADLQQRLDSMSDEQVEKVFEKMRKALASRAKDDVAAAMEQRRGAEGARAPMPRPQVTDPAVRKKYEAELGAIEAELEGMYADPMKVWKDIMLNPDKFMAGKALTVDDLEDEPLQ